MDSRTSKADRRLRRGPHRPHRPADCRGGGTGQGFGDKERRARLLTCGCRSETRMKTNGDNRRLIHRRRACPPLPTHPPKVKPKRARSPLAGGVRRLHDVHRLQLKVLSHPEVPFLESYRDGSPCSVCLRRPKPPKDPASAKYVSPLYTATRKLSR